MNAEQLLTHFDRLADAPDAIPRLRRFILDLAVRGKLVAQDPNDEPASELLKRIAVEKKRRVEAGEIRKAKTSAPVCKNELPFPLPRNWAWSRLHDIGVLAGGMTPSKNRPDFWGGDIVWLSPKDIKADETFNSELKITALGLSDTRLQLYRPGSLFMVARSGILKRTFPVTINRVPAAANQDMKVLLPFLDGQERFLQIMFRGLTEFILAELVKTGTTVQSLKYVEFEQQPFPLPPLTEQHRIVAKVDELLALCDRMVDLLKLIRENYYHPGFRGSYSLKSVAPTLAPSLSYTDLEIPEGMAAAASYIRMTANDTPESEKSHIRDALMAYCQRDTEAMVQIYSALLSEAGSDYGNSRKSNQEES